jgi:CheY-like chemotaxis protein
MDEGYQTVAAFDGRTALELARKIKPDLITLDLALPEVNGFHILQSLRDDDSTRHIPIIVLSTYTDRLCRSHRGLADRIIDKPFDLGEFLQAVGQLGTH